MKKISFLLFLAFFWQFSHANNVSITNVTINGSDIGFNLGWDNSWKDAVNYDAVWVFIKYRQPNGDWLHATLNSSGHNFPAAASFELPSDYKGLFVFRTNTGAGTNTFTACTIRWNNLADGVANTANIQVKVSGIEMVKIPSGNYYLGDGGAFGRFIQQTSTKAVQITDQPTIVKTGGFGDDLQIRQNGILVDGDDGIDVNGITTINNPGYPTGYQRFYIMKYEISQGQYTDFLNTITSTQAASRTQGANANYPIIGFHPNYAANEPERAMAYLNWSDGCAYADWAGLRPMSELEYEKASRGGLFPVPGEFAWGSVSIHNTAYNFVNPGQANESISNPGQGTGNALYNATYINIGMPARSGIFASSAINPNREETGASYYGVMELSGNAFERCVTLGSVTGRNFNGSHGDGALSIDGFSNNSGWPGYSNGTISTSTGAGLRGGAFNYFKETLQVSSRYYAASSDNLRNSSYGFRAVRTAN